MMLVCVEAKGDSSQFLAVAEEIALHGHWQRSYQGVHHSLLLQLSLRQRTFKLLQQCYAQAQLGKISK
jgi:hypothetical protein